MYRLLLAFSVVLIAAAPLADSGRASLSFEFLTHDRSEVIRLGDAESDASLAFRQKSDGSAELSVSVRAHTEADGIEYAATAQLSALVPSGALATGEVDALARQSHATFTTRGSVHETQRRIRATEARLRIDRVTETEVWGSFWLHADRETEARVSGQFVVARPPDA